MGSRSSQGLEGGSERLNAEMGERERDDNRRCRHLSLLAFTHTHHITHARARANTSKTSQTAHGSRQAHRERIALGESAASAEAVSLGCALARQLLVRARQTRSRGMLACQDRAREGDDGCLRGCRRLDDLGIAHACSHLSRCHTTQLPLSNAHRTAMTQAAARRLGQRRAPKQEQQQGAPETGYRAPGSLLARHRALWYGQPEPASKQRRRRRESRRR